MAEITPFTYESAPSRVVFGAGSVASLADEVRHFGFRRALVITTKGQAALGEKTAAQLGDLAIGAYPGAVMHTSAEVGDAGCDEARRLDADCTVAVGGGSAIGLGKVIARDVGLPQIAVPTTYSGSEMTAIWGVTTDGVKVTGPDPKVLPVGVIYDPELTVRLPAGVSGPSGLNAMAHSVEALYAQNANPIASLMAEESIRALGQSLPVVVKEPANLEARGEALYGAWLAGAALAQVGMALHHKLCHTLGGAFDLPHAEVHTILLPHASAYNQAAAAGAMARVARALGANNAAEGIYDLAKAVGAKVALKDIGMREADLDRAADLATRNPYYNPAPVTRDGVRALLDNAFHGRRPAAV